ncbi:Cyclic di-GMP phosphodiesterase [Sporomusa rhizae]|uniref:HD-GYP domain-containing protein n=1 Tax=Sporomusa rhizae TaxID=357999 RepID=UPI00352B12DF
MEGIDRLLPLLGRHHPGTLRHCHSVAMHMFEWSACMDFSAAEMNKAFASGMMHDIGKYCVSAELLSTAGALAGAEQIEFELHPVYGETILQAYGLKEIGPFVLYHHERYDGAGYPQGLKEAAIPFLSRMIAICDVFDELTNRRGPQENLDGQQALAEIERRAGAQFDPWLCEQFIKYIQKISRLYYAKELS